MKMWWQGILDLITVIIVFLIGMQMFLHQLTTPCSKKEVEEDGEYTRALLRGVHNKLDDFSISSLQRSQILMILEDYEDNSFGLEAGSLARQIKELIVGEEQ